MKIYVLQHEHELGDDASDIKLIGVYGSEADALAAQERLSAAPGFSEYPEGFLIDTYELGQDHWIEGFHSIHEVEGRSRTTKKIWGRKRKSVLRSVRRYKQRAA